MPLFRGAETHARSVFKAISWRTLGTFDTFAISWFFTGRVEIAGSIAGFEIVTIAVLAVLLWRGKEDHSRSFVRNE